MGAGIWCWHQKIQKWCIKVGRDFEGSSSKRPELAAIASILKCVHIECPCLILCDNESVLGDIQKWTDEGSKISLTGCRDADIMAEIISLLHDRLQANAPTFFVKIKSHRGEAVNEGADQEATRGRLLPSSMAKWTTPSGKLIFW